jgi:D-alanyl-D-alanine carboxypeptidase/D-alanyl-D-alanine-endopeptidase (penicillin-binding protein 4)
LLACSDSLETLLQKRFPTTLSIVLLLSLLPLCDSVASPPPIQTARELQERIKGVLASKCLDPAGVGIEVVSLKDGFEVYSRNPDVALKPASNQKLFTSAAALALLKPDYVFPTIFYSLEPPKNGVLDGDLYVKGFGAPDLVGEFWWLMVQELYRQGLREVRGNLVGDDTYFDTENRPSVWPSTVPEDSWVNAPVGALSFNYDVVTIRVRPGPAVGKPPQVELVPLESYFKVINRATTTAGRNRLFVDRAFSQDVNTVNVSGSIRLGSGPIEVTKGVENPTLYALSAFQELAARQGIVLRGTARRGTLPEGAREVFRFESKPLSAIVRDMNKHSNNFMAETLLKTLGAEFQGAPGTTQKGLEVVRKYLAKIGVSTGGLTLVDGSGLAHDNRVTARALVDTLRAMNADFELWPEFLSSLPVAGIDGTLQRRFRQEDLMRKVRAKTGKIAGVATLSGYAVNEADETFAFAILINDYRCGTDTIKRLMDRVCSSLVESSLRTEGRESSASVVEGKSGP